MPERFDVCIIGAGPGGLAAALTARRRGLNTLLLERNPVIGEPVNCAEGVTRFGFVRQMELLDVDLDEAWIRTTPKRGRVVAPSGSVFEMHHTHGGVVLDRVGFERALADCYLEAGGDLRLNHRATGLTTRDGRCRCANVVDESGHAHHIEADVFIAGDGVEGMIARKCGIRNNLNLIDTESYLQYHLRDIEVDPDVIEAHLGQAVAPESYAWVFPISAVEANVGLGVPAVFGANRPVRGFLDRFVERRFGAATIVRTSCGTSPRYQGPARLARGNLLVVGDAARVLDSVTGGGILNALASGRHAADAAAAFIESGGENISIMHEVYPTRFLEESHRELDYMLKLKNFLCKLSDDEWNDIVDGLGAYFGDREVESVDVVATFVGVVRKKPRILKIARHLLS
ncbi:geranylgeranyl reductase family protein [candidate division GN15 bacterium]|nr:geranylgeranyl reductase family protein [candidate division GN15 bacterium]